MIRSQLKWLNRQQMKQLTFNRQIVLRQLDTKEASTVTRGTSKTYVNKLRITSQVDLFSKNNIDVLKKSILLWKKSHPFLNCRIVKQNDSDFYFDLIEPTDSTLSNVKFLQLDSYDRVDYSDYVSDLLHDMFNSNPIDPLQTKPTVDLLWRLAIFKLAESCNDYDVMLDIHHSIIQARSSFKIVMQIFQIFEDLLRNKNPNLETYEPYKGAEAVFSHIEKLPPPSNIPIIKAPSFFRYQPDNFSIEKPKKDSKNPHVIDAENGKAFKSLEWLELNSNQAYVRKQHFTIDPQITKRLLEKCKQERVKLGICLEMIVVYSLIDLYEENGYQNELGDIVYYTAICLRRYAGLSEDVMGYLAGGLVSVIENNRFTQLKSNFWSFTRIEAQKFHQRIKTDPRKFFLKIKDVDLSESEINFHFLQSNMMNLDELATTKQGLIRALETYWCSSDELNKGNQLFSNTLCTIGEKIPWSVKYNTNLVSDYFAFQLIRKIMFNINLFLNQN